MAKAHTMPLELAENGCVFDVCTIMQRWCFKLLLLCGVSGALIDSSCGGYENRVLVAFRFYIFFANTGYGYKRAQQSLSLCKVFVIKTLKCKNL